MRSIIYFLALLIFLTPICKVQAMISVGEEKVIGAKLLKQLETQAPLLQDPEIVAWVTDAGKEVLKVIGVSYFDYKFYVLKDEAMNAFAMPGGIVVVHTGLIGAIDSKNELVCILAHEIGHVQGRHIARRMDQMKVVNIGTAILAIAGMFMGGDASGAILTGSLAMGQSLALQYSRTDEEEADRRALQWICKAGYDPMGLVTSLEKMRKNQWMGSQEIPAYLSTHPGSNERMTYIEEQAKLHPCKQIKKEDPLTLKRFQVKIKNMSHDHKEMLMYYKSILAKDPNDMFTLYGYALACFSARDYEESIEYFNRLVKLHPGIDGFITDRASAFFAAGKYKKVIEILEEYRKDKVDPMADYYLGRSYLESGQPTLAMKEFLSLQNKWPYSAPLMFHTGRACAAAGKKGEAHYYFFKYYSMISDMKNAMYHKRKAMELLPPESELREKLRALDHEEGEKKGPPDMDNKPRRFKAGG